MADKISVINVDGHIDSTTWSESEVAVQYAMMGIWHRAREQMLEEETEMSPFRRPFVRTDNIS